MSQGARLWTGARLPLEVYRTKAFLRVGASVFTIG